MNKSMIENELNDLLFYDIENDYNQWCDGFIFHPSHPFFLKQKKGGACGILASIQAQILVYLLKEKNIFNENDLKFISCSTKSEKML